MRRTIEILAKFTLICLGTFAGMIFGATLIYFLFGALYLGVIYSDPDPRMASYECSRGMALGLLSIFIGGLLGAVMGFLCSYKVTTNAPG
jgi:hypothetical protein